jgi:hypothetical protein
MIARRIDDIRPTSQCCFHRTKAKRLQLAPVLG